MARERVFPGLPRGMPEWMAAEYVGASISLFRRTVASQVAAVWIGERRKVWLRDDLDAWLDRRAGRSLSEADDNPWLVADRGAH